MVFCTVPSGEVAAELARALVGEKLAACVNIVPGLRSIYRWNGEICDDAELLLIIKTARDRFEALRARLVQRHPYECPEVVALGIEDGNPSYLDWIVNETR